MSDLTPIDWISVTSIEHLLTCPLSLTHGHPAAATPMPSPVAALGIVAHQLAAEAHSGSFDYEDDLRDALEARWDQLAAEQHQAMLTRDPQAPGPARWRRHGLSRARLTRSLTKAITRRLNGEGPEVVAVEQQLNDDANHIIGRLDRIERHPDGLVVIDLKSGWEPGEITGGQRTQLLTYAHLWHVTNGEWPRRCAIEALNGRQAAFDAEPSEVSALVHQATDARQGANDAIAAGAGPTDLARPAAANCQWCPHRPWCAPHWQAIKPDWDEYLAAFRGTITAADEAARTMTITLDAANIVHDGPVTLTECETTGEAGSIAAVVSAQPMHAPGHYRATSSTTVTLA